MESPVEILAEENQTVAELIRLFRDAARQHSQATLEGDHRVANRAVDQITKIFAQIRRQGVEARQALLEVAVGGDLLEAGLAATYSMKFDPERSLAVLKRLSKDKSILGLTASYAVKRWESGEWGDGLDPE